MSRWGTSGGAEAGQEGGKKGQTGRKCLLYKCYRKCGEKRRTLSFSWKEGVTTHAARTSVVLVDEARLVLAVVRAVHDDPTRYDHRECKGERDDGALERLLD